MKQATIVCLGCILLLGLTGCQSTPTKQSSSNSLQPSQKTLPYGVFDVQSGHGKGQWRKNTETFAR